MNATLHKIFGDRQLFMKHFNVRSLSKNIDRLSYYLSQLHLKPDIIAITETKLCDAKCGNNIQMFGYNFVWSIVWSLFQIN